MLTLDDIKTIKHLRNNRDQSIDQIRKAMNINWRTAKKYADSDQLFITDPIRKNKSMMDDGWGEIIGSWLEEDLSCHFPIVMRRSQVPCQLKTNSVFWKH